MVPQSPACDAWVYDQRRRCHAHRPARPARSIAHAPRLPVDLWLARAVEATDKLHLLRHLLVPLRDEPLLPHTLHQGARGQAVRRPHRRLPVGNGHHGRGAGGGGVCTRRPALPLAGHALCHRLRLVARVRRHRPLRLWPLQRPGLLLAVGARRAARPHGRLSGPRPGRHPVWPHLLLPRGRAGLLPPRARPALRLLRPRPVWAGGGAGAAP
mmetsp:Transcript_18899/g.63768  ORF Transcript_18899/g.63768 Transcript_18899/m.63768 type:complete len:212 (+) Transcript_18899:79-714(+)